jgi:O-antigen ligase
MTQKCFATAWKASAVAFLLFVLLFANSGWENLPGFIGSIAEELSAILRDSETQWMVFLCLGIYFVAFLLLRFRLFPVFWQTKNPRLWLVYALFISAMVYGLNNLPSTDFLTFLGGAVAGQGAVVAACFKIRNEPESCYLDRHGTSIITILLLLLIGASVWSEYAGHVFQYRGHTRWSGPWDNPNIFGLLMGAGIMLALGLSSGARFLASDKCRRWIFAFLCVIGAVLMGYGLLRSYSRGAWLATVCGLAFLLSEFGIRNSEFLCNSCRSWLNRNRFSLFIVVSSLVLLSFWHFRQSDWRPVHRFFSIGNQNDFSWRNRIAVWESALQITAEHPWFGAGWNRPEPLCEHYYVPPKLNQSTAIQMNDYLILGATLGIPALFCFVTYLWLSLTQPPTFNSQLSTGSDLLQATCRAGAIVLLVGFWFDGGLFKLATASTFWILLELGTMELPQRGAEYAKAQTSSK